MTATVTGTSLTLFINNPQVTFSTDWVFTMTSEYSQRPIIDNSNQVQLITQNDRYLEFQVNVPIEFRDQHSNGWYYWTLGGESGYSGFVKLITQPGGDLGTTDYVSDNENREADVYFRPQY